MDLAHDLLYNLDRTGSKSIKRGNTMSNSTGSDMSGNFGGRLKSFRKKRGLTQEQMAEYMGVSSQAVSKWENNISYPDVSLLPILANLFSVTTDELLGVDIARRAEQTEEICRTADELCEAGKFAEAVGYLRNALVKYPGDDSLMYQLAWSLTGTIREQPENLDEAILIYLKILEISSDEALRMKVTRDLMYRYYTKGEIRYARYYAEQLPAFELCREYNLGRGNLLEGRELAKQLKANIRLFGQAMLECMEYFACGNIIAEEEVGNYTKEVAERKIEKLKGILED